MAHNLFIRALLSMRKIDEQTAERAERLVEAAQTDGSEGATAAVLVRHGIIAKKDATRTREAVKEVKRDFNLAQAATDTLKRSSERLAEMARSVSEGHRQPVLVSARRRRSAR